jgi:hypothetical protein
MIKGVGYILNSALFCLLPFVIDYRGNTSGHKDIGEENIQSDCNKDKSAQDFNPFPEERLNRLREITYANENVHATMPMIIAGVRISEWRNANDNPAPSASTLVTVDKTNSRISRSALISLFTSGFDPFDNHLYTDECGEEKSQPVIEPANKNDEPCACSPSERGHFRLEYARTECNNDCMSRSLSFVVVPSTSETAKQSIERSDAGKNRENDILEFHSWWRAVMIIAFNWQKMETCGLVQVAHQLCLFNE